MSELTDFGICEAIAKIEGAIEILRNRVNGSVTAIFEGSTHFDYNPLTDGALCFRLMKKYKVDINNDEDNNLCTAWYAEYKSIQNVDMNKAILLAIIEANKDKL